MKKIHLSFLITLLMLLAAHAATAQYKVIGTVVDAANAQPLPGAAAMIIPQGSTTPTGTSTDLDGKFSIPAAKGKYTFRVTFMGFNTYERQIEVTGADVRLRTVRLKAEDKQIDEVKVTGTLVRQEQKGDTTVFNADAFKVNPDATTEDLIKKMPGIQVSGNTVTSGGETIKKVLVDGKEFFGDDPMVALRNITADMVNKIEVYDKQSDQAQFTGFSDGEEEKTINILTKTGFTGGHFGRVYAGYGSDDRYEAGGNINFFGGNHRVSLIGMLNNVNQQNFSFDDVTGAMSMGGGRSMRGMFNAGQGGENRTGSIGINYCYDNEDKLKVEFSYFYNNNKNVSRSNSMQEYFQDTPEDSLRVYTSDSYSEGRQNNHRASLRLTWTIDENNSIIFTPRVSWQGYKSASWDRGEDSYDANPFSRTAQDDDSKTQGLSGSGNLMWRHKFNKDRRTLTLRVGTSVSTSDADQTSESENEYFTNASRNLSTSQLTDNKNNSTRYNGSIMYTEPIGQYMAVQVNYSPSITINDGDKSVNADTLDASGASQGYAFSPLLSNKKESKYIQQKGGIGLNIFKGREFHTTIGLDVQNATLKGDQEYPYSFTTEKSFTGVLPSVRLRYRPSNSFNMRLDYRTSTSAPSINQLQNVVDVSNTRVYSGGNEFLSQQYSHSLRLFMVRNNVETSRAIFFMGSLTSTQDYIATSSVIASADSVIDNGIILPAGTQYNKPVNMDGYLSANFNLTLSTPVSWLGSNVNLNLGANLTNAPSMYNGREVSNDTYVMRGGVTIGSSFSENFDFTLSYNGNYNIMKSTAAAENNYNYYSHMARADANLLFWQRLVITNSVAHQLTSGMSEDYDKNYVTWNAAIGYKLFKDRRGEIRLKGNDLLNTNTSVNRSIQTAYVQTSTTDVLQRYYMLTFTYKFKPKGNAPSNGNFPPMMGGGPPPPPR